MRQELGHVTKEGEYFHQLDVELIEKMRRRADLEEQRLHMAEASQINDPNILEALEKLGYDPTTVSLLHLVPLVQVAWAGGSVRHAERDRVFAIARLHGVNENNPTYQQLVAWLDQPPPAEFFRGTWRAKCVRSVVKPASKDRTSAVPAAWAQGPAAGRSQCSQ